MRMGGCRLFFLFLFFGFFFLMLLFNRHNKKKSLVCHLPAAICYERPYKTSHARRRKIENPEKTLHREQQQQQQKSSQPASHIVILLLETKKTCFFVPVKKNLSQDNSLITIRSNDNLVCFFFSSTYLCVCVISSFDSILIFFLFFVF